MDGRSYPMRENYAKFLNSKRYMKFMVYTKTCSPTLFMESRWHTNTLCIDFVTNEEIILFVEELVSYQTQINVPYEIHHWPRP